MITKTYIMTTKNSGAEILLHYATDGGYLSGWVLQNDIETQFYPKLHAGIPTTVGQLEQFTKKWKDQISIKEVPPDLSFDFFYEEFGVKDKRKRAKAIWDKMSKAKKIKALLYIKRYKQKCKMKGVSMANPDTYLNQERWTDEE